MANAYWRYAQEKFSIRGISGQLRDERQNPIISPGTVFESVFFSVSLGQKSLLQIDQFARSPAAKEMLGGIKTPVLSDTTMERSLSGYRLNPLRTFSYDIYCKLREEGLGRVVLPSNVSIRAICTDGSVFGGHYASALAVAGSIPIALDVEISQGRGHELETTRKLLARSTQRLGKGWADYLLDDGLYMTRADFSLARSMGMHLVVKTEEETLDVIQNAKGLFLGLEEKDYSKCGIEHIKGVDEKRALSYEVFAVGEILWEGLEFPLKVAWVKEKHLKGLYKGQTLCFWVITTDQALTAEDLRFLAHLRWVIENNLFKKLNALVKSKNFHTKKPHVEEALLLMWFMGLSVWEAFCYSDSLKKLLQTTSLGKVKVTAYLIQFLLWLELSGRSATTLPP